MPAASTLWLGEATWSEHQVSLSYGVDRLRFSTSYWYDDVDLLALGRRYGESFVRRLVFHMAAFEANKAGSLAPVRFDPGPYADLATPAFAELWTTVFDHVWAQWRYEHDRPEFRAPALEPAAGAGHSAPVEVTPGPLPVLAFCGGGKDSLVSLRLLERAGVPYASYAYSSSIYGQPGQQHALIAGLLDHLGPARRHRHWVFDDFLDAPLLELKRYATLRSLTAAETPSSVFGSLPVALAHGYEHLVCGHERSADVGNLVWKRTGEEVNHQWGKSLAAERMLQSYVRSELVANVTYASNLKPLNDVVIFADLARHLDAVPATHSCNTGKPWCRRCAKCAYVWINYQAYLPRETVDAIFGENLLDAPENLLWYRQMLGLEDHTPFECVGMIEEARLAFALARAKGLRGAAMDVFDAEVGPLDVDALAARFVAVVPGHHARAACLADRGVPELAAMGRRAEALLVSDAASTG